jgi:hypothetical protein
MSALNDAAYGLLLSAKSGSSLTTRLTNVTGSAAIPTLYAPVAGRSCFTMQAVWTGNFTGSLAVQGSNISGSWATYVTASIGAGSESTHLFNVSDFGAANARLLITPTTGLYEGASMDVHYRGKK